MHTSYNGHETYARGLFVNIYIYTHKHTHTHIYTHIYIYTRTVLTYIYTQKYIPERPYKCLKSCNKKRFYSISSLLWDMTTVSRCTCIYVYYTCMCIEEMQQEKNLFDWQLAVGHDDSEPLYSYLCIYVSRGRKSCE
jgi:hypothetical protein